MEVPDHVSHYYLPSRRPFQNLSELDDERVDEVMRELNELRSQGVQHRPFGRRYIQWRRLTEERLHESFVAAGGRPDHRVPHYFCLGASPWFEGLAQGMLAITVRLEELPPDKTSFTLVDSFGAMGFGPLFGFPASHTPHQQRVYRLDELYDVLSGYEPPDGGDHGYDGFENRPVNTFVEVQLWTDAPVAEWLSG